MRSSAGRPRSALSRSALPPTRWARPCRVACLHGPARRENPGGSEHRVARTSLHIAGIGLDQKRSGSCTSVPVGIVVTGFCRTAVTVTHPAAVEATEIGPD